MAPPGSSFRIPFHGSAQHHSHSHSARPSISASSTRTMMTMSTILHLILGARSKSTEIPVRQGQGSQSRPSCSGHRRRRCRRTSRRCCRAARMTAKSAGAKKGPRRDAALGSSGVEVPRRSSAGSQCRKKEEGHPGCKTWGPSSCSAFQHEHRGFASAVALALSETLPWATCRNYGGHAWKVPGPRREAP